jgi:hypothetical protein
MEVYPPLAPPSVLHDAAGGGGQSASENRPLKTEAMKHSHRQQWRADERTCRYPALTPAHWGPFTEPLPDDRP